MFSFFFLKAKDAQEDLAQHLAASSKCQVDSSTFRKGWIRNDLCGRIAAKQILFLKVLVPLFKELVSWLLLVYKDHFCSTSV